MLIPFPPAPGAGRLMSPCGSEEGAGMRPPALKTRCAARHHDNIATTRSSTKTDYRATLPFQRIAVSICRADPYRACRTAYRIVRVALLRIGHLSSSQSSLAFRIAGCAIVRNCLDDFDSLLNADGPELGANTAIRFKRISGIQRPLKIWAGKCILE